MSVRFHYQQAAKRARAAADRIIPHDVITIILLKLPVNILLKFRSVSKQWNEIITSFMFAKEHINNIMIGKTASACAVVHSYSPSALIRFHATRIRTDSYRAKAKTHRIKGSEDIIKRYVNSKYYLISSCNGLLCMARVPPLGQVLSSTFMQVCNLATGKYTDVPRLPLEFDQMYARFTFLGFGYDPSIDDYKIIYTYKTGSSPNWRVLVLSLKTNTWRSTDSSASPDLSRVSLVGAFGNNNQVASVSGDLYWIVQTTGRATIHHKSVRILRCNLAEERFDLLPFPKQTTVETGHINHSVVHTRLCKLVSTLSIHNGSLHIFMPQKSREDFHFGVSYSYCTEINIWKLEWRMLGHGPIWRKVGVIPTFKGNMLDALGFNCNGHVIMKRRIRRSWLNLYAYLPEKNKFVMLCQVKSDPCVHLIEMETLASP